jgi:hypothetical protein
MGFLLMSVVKISWIGLELTNMKFDLIFSQLRDLIMLGNDPLV